MRATLRRVRSLGGAVWAMMVNLIGGEEAAKQILGEAAPAVPKAAAGTPEEKKPATEKKPDAAPAADVAHKEAQATKEKGKAAKPEKKEDPKKPADTPTIAA